MSKRTSQKMYDVAVIGGGLSGMTTACALGRAGLSVACIDQADPEVQLRADIRTTAISYGSKQILDEAGLWEGMADKACPIEDIRILDGDSPVLLTFLSREAGGRIFGWILDNRDIRRNFLNAMAGLETVTHLAPARVADFRRPDDGSVEIVLESGETLAAKLVIGADGRGSFARAWMGVHTRGHDYGQQAVICIAAHENPHNNAAVEHFQAGGPFAVLPMTDDNSMDGFGRHRSSVVFTEHCGKRRSRMRLSDAEFTAALQAQFPSDYGRVELVGKRACYPLNLIHAAEYIAPRMALVADAAHGIHPIAGQGLNLGFRDVGELVRLVIAAHEKGEDVGSRELLETYQRRRRPDNMAMIAVTDGLVKLFSNDIPPVRLLRRAGLKMVAQLPPAKRFFMRQAMGAAGRQR